MEEVLKQLNELCRDTLVDNLGMVFTAAGEGWLEARMPIDRRTCRPDGALHGGANMALAETVGGALSSMSVPPENRFGFIGNHPFFTLPFCSKISRIVQKEEKAKTPNKDDHKTCRTYKAAMIPKIPKIKNIHQQRVPK